MTAASSRATRRRVALVAVGASLVIAACSGDGGSLSNAGNTTVAPAVTAAPGDTTAGTTAGTTATTAAPSTTVADALADLPTCNTGALDTAAGPVEITFWHGMTADLEKELTRLTDQYNSSQSKVTVTLQNQGGYEPVIDKYLQSSQDSRPDLVQAPEYAVQSFRDTNSFIPVEACSTDAGYDTSALLSSAVNAYATGGVQWAMPFNVSNPVLYYNKKVFAAAGLDPNKPPTTLDELAAVSKQIVESGAAKYGLVLDTSFDSGGGWFIEQWFAKAGEFYADNDNGRLAPATKVLFDNQTGVDIMTFLQQGVQNGSFFNVGDNASGQDTFLKLADVNEPGAMTIATSAGLGTVLSAIAAGIAPLIAVEDLGVAPMPGPNASPTVLVGGASLWIPADKGDEKAAAAWDFIQYLVSAETQSAWSSATGYVPMRDDAVDLDPLQATYAADPRFRVAFDALVATPDEPTAVGPLLGPQREVRVLTSRAMATALNGGDPAAALSDAATQANQLLADYQARQAG
ncbi:MAG: ABC transporter substrate-binding protein [Ilumatobacteraceae bacterium]